MKTTNFILRAAMTIGFDEGIFSGEVAQSTRSIPFGGGVHWSTISVRTAAAATVATAVTAVTGSGGIRSPEEQFSSC